MSPSLVSVDYHSTVLSLTHRLRRSMLRQQAAEQQCSICPFSPFIPHRSAAQAQKRLLFPCSFIYTSFFSLHPTANTLDSFSVSFTCNPQLIHSFLLSLRVRAERRLTVRMHWTHTFWRAALTAYVREEVARIKRFVGRRLFALPRFDFLSSQRAVWNKQVPNTSSAAMLFSYDHARASVEPTREVKRP
jgi:hypothetical protein